MHCVIKTVVLYHPVACLRYIIDTFVLVLLVCKAGGYEAPLVLG